MSSFLHGKTAEKIQKIVESSHFQQCLIFCTVHEYNYDLVFKQEGNAERENYLEKFKDALKYWMNNKVMNYTTCWLLGKQSGIFSLAVFH